MYNSTEYSDDYLKTFGILWQYCGEKPVINAANGAMANFTADNADTNLFEIKERKTTSQTGNNGTKNVEIMVPLKYLSTFWRLLNCL